MQSISVKAVLTGLFALLVLMIGGLGLMAIAELAKTNAHVSEFSDDYLPSIDELGDINAAMADIRYMGAEYIFADDVAERAAKAKELGEAEQRLSDDLTAFSQLAASGGESQLLAEFQAKRASYEQLHNKMLELTRSGQREQAETLFAGDMQRAYKELGKLINRMVDLNRTSAKQASVQSHEDYDSVRWQTILVVVAGLTLAVAATVFSFVGVSGPIGDITRAMATLAGGDTSVQIPFGNRRNEIGAMAGAVQVFKDNLIRSNELEIEAEAAKARLEAERRRVMRELADQFERAVGGIVRTVSEAAAELQAAAQGAILGVLANHTSVDHRRGSFRAGGSERPHRCCGCRGALGLGPRDHPAGKRIRQHGPKGGARGRANHGAGKRLVGRRAEDWRYRGSHQRYCVQNQSPGAECHDRSCAGRRGWSWLRRGRL
jgi:methyl-accepting chemotaxis protein